MFQISSEFLPSGSWMYLIISCASFSFLHFLYRPNYTLSGSHNYVWKTAKNPTTAAIVGRDNHQAKGLLMNSFHCMGPPTEDFKHIRRRWSFCRFIILCSYTSLKSRPLASEINSWIGGWIHRQVDGSKSHCSSQNSSINSVPAEKNLINERIHNLA